MTIRDIETLFRVRPGRRAALADRNPGWSGPREYRQLKSSGIKEQAKVFLAENLRRLADAQERLYANDVYSVLVILQAMDAAGKDGMIKHVMSGLNPQGCQVFSFKKPSDEELDHDFLWRTYRCLPERGRIGIFNRSYYEETLVVRVHPELLERQRLPPGKRGRRFWSERYESINAFEQHLVRNGTLILKFFLHISKKEQKQRFLERLDNPDKHWKFSLADLEERDFWGDYQDAFEETITSTSTPWAPWWVIPADNKWVSRVLVSAVLTDAIKGLGLRKPEVSPEQKPLLARARRRLLGNGQGSARSVRAGSTRAARRAG
jgi:PPK2 family polyphosphate:nucleotide phosphotransferase